MIIIGKYEEFAPGMGFPSLKNDVQETPHSFKKDILEYLNSGNVHMVTASKFVDIFTGETVNKELVFMDDGTYSWSSKIPYYFDKYNLRLPEAFVNHILSQMQ